MERGFQVFALNPKQLDRFRDVSIRRPHPDALGLTA